MSTPVKTRDWTSADAGAEIVRYRAEDGIAVIEMDDPPANTYTYAMMRQLDDAVLKARFDDDVHVIILRGKGDRFFSAGANIGMLNAVTPGFITTDMTAGLSPELKEKMSAAIPLSRIGNAEEVAAAVAFLASDSASYITGEVLKVNGGMYM